MIKYLQFLSGGGEMGALMRAYNWESSPVGGADKWPQSLLTTLGILLNSKFPMFLIWGPQHICFYNDAYRQSLGNKGKHPGILGKKGEEEWPEIWHIIKPLIDQVLTGDEATWREDQIMPIYRNGKMEDVYWSFSYSPVKDESGLTAGVYVTCTETTGKVNNLKKLAESNDQLSFAIEATQLGTWEYSPVTNKFISNNRLKEWFGLPHEMELDLSLAIELIVEKDRSRVSKAIQRAMEYESGGLYDIEYSIINPVNNQERIVRAKGKAWFGDKKKPYRFNGTLQDITQQAIASKQIEASEAKFRNLILQAPVAITTYLGPSFIVDTVNNAALEIGGKPYDQVINKPLFEVSPELENGLKTIYNQVFTKGEPFIANEVPVQLNRTGKPEQAYFNKVFQPLRDLDNEIYGIISIAMEVTEAVNARKQIEKNVREISDYKYALDESSIVAITDQKGIIKYVNDNFCTISKYTRHELIGQDHRIINSGYHSKDFIRNLWTTISNGKTWKGELKNKAKDGTNYWVDTTIVPFLDELGKPYQYVAIRADITAQKKSEEAVEKMASHLKLATDSANVGTWSFNVQKQELVWSALHKKMWGYNEHRQDLAYEDWYKIILPGDKEKVSEKVEEARVNHTTYDVDYCINRANDGVLRCIRSVGKYYYNDKGEAETLTGISIDITEQREAEEKIKEAHKLFETTLQHVPSAIYNFDKSGKILYLNEIGANQIGYATIEEVLTEKDIFQLRKTAYETFTILNEQGEPMPVDQNSTALAFKTGKSSEVVSQLIHKKTGTSLWLLSKASPLYDDNGVLIKVIATSTDITLRKTSEQTLHQSEEHFRTITNNIQNMAWIANVDGRIYWYNQRWYDYTGTTFEEMESLGWEKVHHPNYIKEVKEFTNEALKKDEAFERTFPLRRHDGEYRWFLTRVYPLKDANGKVERWIGTNTDITEQKNFSEALEEKVEERTAELAERNIFIETLIDSSIDLIIAFDKDLRYMSMNKAAMQTLAEHFPDGVIGKKMYEVVPHVHQSGAYANVLSSLEGNIISQKGYKSFYGSKYFDVDFIPLQNEKEVYGVMTVSRDVTENVLAAQEMKTKNIALQNANAELHSFNFIASHDLQEPLRKIQLFSKHIAETEKFSEKTQNYFNRIISAGERMQNLIVSLLDLSRTSATELIFEPCDLNAIVEESKDDLQLVITEKQAVVEYENLPTINASHIQLSQLFTNLIDNAIKYSRPQIKPHIKIAASIVEGEKIEHPSANQKDYYAIKIADNGIGFNQEYATKIFEIFQRLHGKNEYSGTGIGLAIVKKIVTNHNGFIVAEGVPGIGSIFTIYIPTT